MGKFIKTLKAIKSIVRYIYGDYGLPLYESKDSFIRLADEANGKSREFRDSGVSRG